MVSSAPQLMIDAGNTSRQPSPNRPPVFTSVPIVSGNVNTAYTYQATATDADNDPLTFALVSGPLWGRVVWGVYWIWDARLTSSLLLWLMLIAYLLARRYGGPAARKLARMASC